MGSGGCSSRTSIAICGPPWPFNRTPTGRAGLGGRWQVEPTIAFLVRYQGCRRARRLGQAAAQCQLYQACAMRNLLLWLSRVRRGLSPRPAT